MNHTPTPWYISDSRFTKGNVILSKIEECGAHVCTMPEFKDAAQANAAHIVRCVNAHKGLVEAVELLLRHAPTKFYGAPYPNSDHQIAAEFARNVLRQAKGE